MTLGFSWPPPQEGGRLLVPVHDARLERVVDQRCARAGASGERPLTQDLPEPLDEVKPGGGFGQGHEVETRVTPVPQHRLHAPMQWQSVHDQIRVAGWREGFQPIEEA